MKYPEKNKLQVTPISFERFLRHFFLCCMIFIPVLCSSSNKDSTAKKIKSIRVYADSTKTDHYLLEYHANGVMSSLTNYKRGVLMQLKFDTVGVKIFDLQYRDYLLEGEGEKLLFHRDTVWLKEYKADRYRRIVYKREFNKAFPGKASLTRPETSQYITANEQEINEYAGTDSACPTKAVFTRIDGADTVFKSINVYTYTAHKKIDTQSQYYVVHGDTLSTAFMHMEYDSAGYYMGKTSKSTDKRQKPLKTRLYSERIFLKNNQCKVRCQFEGEEAFERKGSCKELSAAERVPFESALINNYELKDLYFLKGPVEYEYFDK